jgi:pterin-4a-carbinolamine dehydratase
MKLLELLDTKGSTSLPNTSVEMALGNLQTTVPSMDLPISPEESSWVTFTDPERLSRTFNFGNFSNIDYFVNELLKYQEAVSHHAKIIIDHRDVTVETYTHDINTVTEQDKNLAKFCDEIYNDVRFFIRDGS